MGQEEIRTDEAESIGRLIKSKEGDMQAQLELTLRETDHPVIVTEKKGIRFYVKRIRDMITKYVTYDKDAIFKDPNWPHLWS